MRIYQNLGINLPEDANLLAGTVGLPFVIESAQIVDRAYGERNALQMGLREKDRDLGLTFGYGLIGEEVYEPFMRDAEASDTKSLVGKTVLAFIPPNQDVAKGLTVRK